MIHRKGLAVDAASYLTFLFRVSMVSICRNASSAIGSTCRSSLLRVHGDIPMSVQAMKAGAVEFLTKPFGDDVLLSAIRNAIERSQATLGREAEIRALRDCYASLTPRERQVMALVASGLLNKQVGGELNISEITVKAHRGQVMRKMKADSLADLVTMAARLRLARTPGPNPLRPPDHESFGNKRHL